MRKDLKDYTIDELAEVCELIKVKKVIFDKQWKDMMMEKTNPFDYSNTSILIKEAYNLYATIYDYAKKEYGAEEADKWIDTNILTNVLEDLYIDEMKSVCF